MADVEVIYDPVKEMACIVNVDTRQGWGPAMIGPHAGEMLQAFVDAAPFDITLMKPDTAAEAFSQFLDQLAGRILDSEGETDTGAVERGGDSDLGVAGDDLLTAAVEADSRNADAPADTDQGAQEAPPAQVVTCFNCNGKKVIEFGDGSEPQRCNMCQGTGKILQAV